MGTANTTLHSEVYSKIQHTEVSFNLLASYSNTY